MVAAGALAGAGVVLAVRGAVGQAPPLGVLVTELHRPRTPTTAHGRGLVVGRLAGRPSAALAADLAVLEWTPQRWVQARALWALLGATPGLALSAMSAGGAIGVFPPAVLVMSVPAGAAAGWFYARIDLRSDAEAARREFRHALAAYLELVCVLMAGGAGVETALFDAASVGRGPALRHLRTALSVAQARRQAPWQLLGELGDRVGVVELEALHASVSLAGDGAQVRDSLAAKADGIRLRDLARTESEAQSRTETMVLPVALMFAGFLTLIGYPALAALSTP